MIRSRTISLTLVLVRMVRGKISSLCLSVLRVMIFSCLHKSSIPQAPDFSKRLVSGARKHVVARKNGKQSDPRLA